MLEKFNQYRQTWTLPLNRHKANNQTQFRFEWVDNLKITRCTTVSCTTI